ncbi:MAG: hypothetical protein M3Y64_06230 [Gemmatimonadota bacterium]|nr:hypothetical protein [Gemmatimonadota bacterium]
MSINGITNPLLTNIGPLSRPGDSARTPSDRVSGNASSAGSALAPALRQPLPPQAAIAGLNSQSVVPAEAPAGTDPALWSVLTTDERNFFAKSASLGPLTYGRIKSSTVPTAPSVRGGRLDVRA